MGKQHLMSCDFTLRLLSRSLHICCEAAKPKLARKAIRSAVQDVGALVINLLIDVSSTMRDLESPAELHAEAFS